jgi:hypothetical protein
MVMVMVMVMVIVMFTRSQLTNGRASMAQWPTTNAKSIPMISKSAKQHCSQLLSPPHY